MATEHVGGGADLTAIERVLRNEADDEERRNVVWFVAHDAYWGKAWDSVVERLQTEHWMFVVKNILGSLYTVDPMCHTTTIHSYCIMQGDPKTADWLVQGRFPEIDLSYLGAVPLCEKACSVIQSIPQEVTAQLQSLLNGTEGKTFDTLRDAHIIAAEILVVTNKVRHQLFYGEAAILLEVIQDLKRKPAFQLYPLGADCTVYSERAFPVLQARPRPEVCNSE